MDRGPDPIPALIMIVAAAVTKTAVLAWKFLVRLFSKTWTILVAAAISVAIALYARYYLKKAAERKRELEKTVRFRELQRREKERAYDQLYNLLACRPDLVPALSAIPPEHRTLRLRYLDLKAKVCRPFAAS